MRLTASVASVMAVAALAGCGSPPAAAPPWSPTGIVVGGISRCSGLPVSGPRYVPGTLTVLRGVVRLQPGAPGSWTDVFPREQVTQQRVGATGLYRLRLRPGPYVLRAAYTSGNAEPWISVVVRPGMTIVADIPNMCI